MTKAELINTFSEKVGIDKSDSKIFFEILLRKISAIIKSGQSIFIPEFGFFHLIKGKLRRLSNEGSENVYEEFIDIILYSSEEKLSQSETEGFVFNVPFIDDENSSEVDSYFSLSIGKPLIPLRGYFDRNNYIPTSGNEHQRYLETKAGELIEKSKVLSSDEQFPTLIIDAISYNSNELHLEKTLDELDFLLSDEQLTNENITKGSDENVVKNIAWDFGEVFSQKISAESIFELADERISQPTIESTDNKAYKEINNDQKEQENVLDQLLDNDKDEINLESSDDENVKEKISEEKKSGSEPRTDSDLLNELMEYEEVQSDGESEQQSKETADDLSDDEFWKNTSKLFETFNPREIRTDDEKEFTEVKAANINLGDFSNNKGKTKLADDIEKSEDEISGKQKSNINISLDEEVEKNKRSKKWVFVIPVLLILIAFAIYYWYSQLNKKSEQVSAVNELSISSTNANVIERDYEIPVSYPYVPESSLMDSLGEVTGKSQTSDKVVEQKPDDKKITKQEISTAKKNSETKNTIPDGRPISLGKNIYKYGNIYVVQVASFRSNQIAENEAGKYRNKGFNSFVEPVEIKDKGLWYRIKVGNFNKLSEAEDFISKNNR